MIELIEQYIKYYSKAWTETTIRTTKARLRAVSGYLDANPPELWDYLVKSGFKASSRGTTWTQVVAFWDWLIEEGFRAGPNPFKVFRKRHRQMFKNTSVRRRLNVTFQEAKERIEKISDEATKRRALEILYSGARWHESCQTGPTIRGKGGKLRKLFRPELCGPDFVRSYHTFWRILRKETGLKPHDLRALAATELSKHLDDIDLMEVFGWSNIQTSTFYRQPQREQELEEKVRRVQK